MRRLLLLVCLLSLAAPATAAAATAGVNVPLLDSAGDPYVRTGADAARTWRAIVDAHARTVRSYVTWNRIDAAALDRYARFAHAARSRGLKVELAVTGTAANMATPGAYADAIGRLARRLRGSVMGYEIWNEEDDPGWWSGGADPAAYAALLAAAHGAVHRADPRAKVVLGGLVANDYDFLAGAYAHGAKGSFDAVAVHTDTGCNTTDPAAYYREPSGRIGRYAFTGYRELRKLMRAHGDAKPIWMSELGWSTFGGGCPAAAKAGGVPPAQQAAFLTRAYRCLARDRYVTQGMWFDLADISSHGADPTGQFGLLDDAFAPKPALAAFRRARHARPMRCGGVLDGRRPAVAFVHPANDTHYFSGLPVRVRACDDRGVKDINLFLDGRYVPLRTRIHGRRATIATFLRSAGTLAYGPHRLVAKARDEARNWGTTRITIVRVGGGRWRTRIASRLHLALGPVRRRALAVRGHMSFSGGVVGEGTVVMRFERRVKGAWRLQHIRHRSAHRTFRFSVPLGHAGTWRARGAFVPAGPFTRASVPTRILRIG